VLLYNEETAKFFVFFGAVMLAKTGQAPALIQKIKGLNTMAGKHPQEMKFEEFDIMNIVRRDNEGSIWKGAKGVYVIRHLQQPRNRKRAPVAKVILNNEFLTGLFRTRNRKLFVGDIRTPEGRKLLRFKTLNNFQIVSEMSLDYLQTNA